MRSIVTALLVVLAAPLAPACASEPAAAAPPDEPVATAPQPPPRTKVIASTAGVINTGWAADWAGFAGTSRGCMRSYSFGRFAVPMPLEEGDRMLSLTFSAIGNYSADLDVYGLSAAPDGTLTLGAIGALGIHDVPGDDPLADLHGKPQDYTIDLVDTLVTGGVAWWFEFSADQAGLCVGALRLTYDRPNG